MEVKVGLQKKGISLLFSEIVTLTDNGSNIMRKNLRRWMLVCFDCYFLNHLGQTIRTKL